MAQSFRESLAAMAGTVHGAILDELMNEVAAAPEDWPFIKGRVRIACTAGDTSPAFVLLYGVTSGTIAFVEVNVSETLGAWGTERVSGERSH